MLVIEGVNTINCRQSKTKQQKHISHERRRCNDHENKSNGCGEIKLDVMDHGTEALAA